MWDFHRVEALPVPESQVLLEQCDGPSYFWLGVSMAFGRSSQILPHVKERREKVKTLTRKVKGVMEIVTDCVAAITIRSLTTKRVLTFYRMRYKQRILH